MAGGYKSLIKLIQNGDNVDAATINRALRDLSGNTDYVKQLLEQSLLGQAIFARCVTVEPGVSVGMPVYFNAATSRFERGLAGATTDTDTGVLITTPATQIWGVVYHKTNATLADLVLGGYVPLDISAATGVTEPAPAGMYYLDATTPGKISLQTAPISVPVLQSDGAGHVLVHTQFYDSLLSHKHYKFQLKCKPAGDTTPPEAGERHEISEADSGVEGWLPAAHVSFGGKAPTGAVFGYNIAQSKLAAIWPPLPISGAYLEWFKDSDPEVGGTGVPLGMHGLCVIDVNGIWWMSDCYNEAPWPLAWDSTLLRDACGDVVGVDADGDGDPDSSDSSDPGGGSGTPGQDCGGPNPSLPPCPPGVGTPNCGLDPDLDPCPATGNEEEDCNDPNTEPECPRDLIMRMFLYFTKPTFHSGQTAVTSLQAADGSHLSITCAQDGSPATTGDLVIDLDLDFVTDEDNVSGHLVFKELEGNTFKRGTVVESLKADSDNVTITSNVTIGDDGKAVGQLGITVDNDLDSKELPVQVVKLNKVDEVTYQGVLGLELQAGRTANYLGQINVPDKNIPTGAQAKLRFRVLARGAGAFPPLSLSVNVVAETTLNTPAALAPTTPTITFAPTLTSNFTTDQYVDVESSAFDISAGDSIFFTLGRSVSGDSGPTVHIIRHAAVVVAE